MTDHGAAAPEQLLLASIFERVGRRIPAPELDTLWIFPTRRAPGYHSIVIVVSAFDGSPERRRVFTARASLRSDRKGRPLLENDLAEHGLAPADRVRRIIELLVRRLDRFDEPTPPDDAAIAGDPERWARLHLRLGIPLPPAADPSAPDVPRDSPAPDASQVSPTPDSSQDSPPPDDPPSVPPPSLRAAP